MLTNKRALGFKDVLISPQPSRISSRKEVHLDVNWLGIPVVPVIASNMQNIGTFKVARILSEYKMLTCLTKDTTLAAYEANYQIYPDAFPYIIPSFGLREYDKIDALLGKGYGFKVICLDVANGYMRAFNTYVNNVKKFYPEIKILAGNVATASGAYSLSWAGADIIKVGLGSGAVCTTRFKTGVGVPQITAIHECSEEIGNYICSDGGCTSPGDIAKAFVAGADFVMIGGMLAGHQETGVVFNGSAFDNDRDYKTSEGKKVYFTDSEKPLRDTIESILGGLRSCGSYIGKVSIADFYKAELIQVTEQTNNWFGLPS